MLLHALNVDDPDWHYKFSGQVGQNPSVTDKVVWNDKATFKLNERINNQTGV